MFDEQVCKKALENLKKLERDDNFKNWGGQVAPQVNCDVINQLIKDCFESKENTLEFKNFRLHADSTLKCMSKDELINYIHMLHHNWGVSDEQLFNVFKINNKLQDELDIIKNIKPYKYEDLKVGMWVWDEKEKKCNKIIEIEGRNIDFYYITESIDRFIVEFEENRFYPVTKAMEYQK